MVKIDVNGTINALDGQPVLTDGKEGPESTQDLLISVILLGAIFTNKKHDIPLTGVEHMERYGLGGRIVEARDTEQIIEFTSDEVVKIKEWIAFAEYPSVVYGFIDKIFERGNIDEEVSEKV